MTINFSIFRNCKHPDRREICDVVAPISVRSFDLREEYASAFRTESYTEFWARVIDLTFTKGSGSTPRLPSYRLFTERLLDPDQPTITKILARVGTRSHPSETNDLLSDYYSETANASLLCGHLLKDIEHVRLLYRPLKSNLASLLSGDRDALRAIDHSLSGISFDSLISFQSVHDGTSRLLKRLESSRKKARARLRFVKRVKRALTVFFIAIAAASMALVGAHIVTHGLVALMVAAPSFRWLRCLSDRWMAGVVAQLDAAAKGTYIMNRDLDTVSRLVARLRDEVEHMAALLRFSCRDDRRRLAEEVVRQIRRNDGRFRQQVDELEEHLYLCFMTINKARGIVMKEVLVASGGKDNGL